MYLPLGQGSVLYVIEVLVQRIAGPKKRKNMNVQ